MQEAKKMTTLVTGGAGFIGSHLTESLLGSGEDVIILDDLSTGSERNLTEAMNHPSLQFVKGSILDESLVDELASKAQTIYHLAAAVGTFTIIDKTLESLYTNLHGTENIVNSALRHGARVLIASTSEIYGKNTKIGLREDDDRHIGSPLKNRWSYAEAKAIDETLAYLYSVEYGLQTVIVRLFNTVGPRQAGRYGMVIPRFVRQALAGEPLTVYGTGDQIRCFCHVYDVVPAVQALMADTRAYSQAFNIGGSEQVSINQLAERVVTLLGSSSTITHVPYEAAYGAGFEDMQRRVPDCTKARQQIGFQPGRTLEDVIQDVAADQLARSASPSVSTR
jgi:UDP-glucose 4-epimerase